MLSDYEPVKDSVEPTHFNDLGNLMLAFALLWAYMSFAQFLIIWAGNLKEEIPWYMQRAFGAWASSLPRCWSSISSCRFSSCCSAE